MTVSPKVHLGGLMKGQKLWARSFRTEKPRHFSFSPAVLSPPAFSISSRQKKKDFHIQDARPSATI